MLDYIEQSAISGNNKYLMIFLHGYGSDKYDLFELKDKFYDISGDICYISVNAPYKCETSSVGYQWFSLKELTPLSIKKEINNNNIVLQNFIDEQSKRLNIPYKNIILFGFSQGSIMALYTSIRLNRKLSGIIVFSGLLPDTVEDFKYNIVTKQKILMVHGSEDKVIAYQYFLDSIKMLKMEDFDIKTYTSYGLGHSIDIIGIEQAREFLKHILK